MGHFKRKFQVERDIPTNFFWCQQTRLVTLSCGVKIAAVYPFFSSQSTRVSDGWTDGLSYDPQDRASIADLRGKNHNHKKNGRGLGLGKLPNFWYSPLYFCNGCAVLFLLKLKIRTA